MHIATIIQRIRFAIALCLLAGYLLLTHIIVSYVALEKLAKYAIRYAVTSEYDGSVCDETATLTYALQIPQITQFNITTTELAFLDKLDGEVDCRIPEVDHLQSDIRQTLVSALMDAARYFSILNLIKNNTPGILNPTRLTVAVCSDSQGYSYDLDKGTCSPQNTTGEAGGSVIVRINYNYQLGAFFGQEWGNIPLSVSQDGSVECFRLGCGSGLQIILEGNTPNEFSIEILDETGSKKMAQCIVVNDQTVILGDIINDQNASCAFLTPSAFFPGYLPDEVTVTVRWANNSVTQSTRPIYRTQRPNGDRCPPECRLARIIFTLP